jgi:hypothetical protein
MSEPRHHLIIAGPGRAGTSVLVQLLTALGLDTGAEDLAWHPGVNAGLERNLERNLQSADSHYVVKSPYLSWRLGRLIADGTLPPSSVDGVIVPLRDLDEAARSRFVNSVRARKIKTPGGLVRARTLTEQRVKLAESVYELSLTIAEHQIPFALLAYPRFTRDWEYAYRQLHPVLGDGITEAQFEQAWKGCMRSDLTGSGAAAIPFATRVYWENRWRAETRTRDLRRRLRRTSLRKQTGPLRKKARSISRRVRSLAAR